MTCYHMSDQGLKFGDCSAIVVTKAPYLWRFSEPHGLADLNSAPQKVQGNGTICIPWPLMMANAGYVRVWENVCACMGVCIYRSVYILMNVNVWACMWVCMWIVCMWVCMHALCVYVCMCVNFDSSLFHLHPSFYPQNKYQQRHNCCRVSFWLVWGLLSCFYFSLLLLEVCKSPSLTPWRHDPSSGESISGMWLLFNASTVPSLIFFLFKFPVFFPLLLSSSSLGGPGQPSLPVLLCLLFCNSEWRLLCPLWRAPNNNKIADNAKDSF